MKAPTVRIYGAIRRDISGAREFIDHHTLSDKIDGALSLARLADRGDCEYARLNPVVRISTIGAYEVGVMAMPLKKQPCGCVLCYCPDREFMAPDAPHMGECGAYECDSLYCYVKNGFLSFKPPSPTTPPTSPTNFEAQP